MPHLPLGVVPSPSCSDTSVPGVVGTTCLGLWLSVPSGCCLLGNTGLLVILAVLPDPAQLLWDQEPRQLDTPRKKLPGENL